MYRISGDELYRNIARSLVESYAAGVAKGPAPINYKKNANHPHGYYRVDLMLQQGCALIQAAKEFGKPAWETTGRKMVEFIYEHAYLKQYRCFAISMDELLTAEGKINPNETIYRRRPRPVSRRWRRCPVGRSGADCHFPAPRLHDHQR